MALIISEKRNTSEYLFLSKFDESGTIRMDDPILYLALTVQIVDTGYVLDIFLALPVSVIPNSFLIHSFELLI